MKLLYLCAEYNLFITSHWTRNTLRNRYVTRNCVPRYWTFWNKSCYGPFEIIIRFGLNRETDMIMHKCFSQMIRNVMKPDYFTHWCTEINNDYSGTHGILFIVVSKTIIVKRPEIVKSLKYVQCTFLKHPHKHFFQKSL